MTDSQSKPAKLTDDSGQMLTEVTENSPTAKLLNEMVAVFITITLTGWVEIEKGNI